MHRFDAWLASMPLELCLQTISYLDTAELLRAAETWLLPLQQQIYLDAHLWRRKVFRPVSMAELHAACSPLLHVFQAHLMGLDLSQLDCLDNEAVLKGLLSKLTQVSCLSLARTRLPSTWAQSLFSALQTACLVELNLSHCSWLNDVVWAALFAPTSSWPALKRLNLSACIALSDASLGQMLVSQPAVVARLSHVHLSGCSFSSEALAQFLPLLQSVSWLSLSRLPLLSFAALYKGLTRCYYLGTGSMAASFDMGAGFASAPHSRHACDHACTQVLDHLRYLDVSNNDDLTRQEVQAIRAAASDRTHSARLLIVANPRLEDHSEQGVAAFLKLFCQA